MYHILANPVVEKMAVDSSRVAQSKLVKLNELSQCGN